ncbi:MAG: nitrite/sulfite reductase [Pseudomonadota bacterium]
MYRQTDFDAAFLAERRAQFRAQVARRLSGALTEDEFRPLRLMNGVYLQLHAYMLRVALPYGTLSSDQMRALADVADRWDKGYGHVTTRQNMQFNWPRLEDIPDILDHLGTVGLHATQTSGNCIRNVTADPFAGAAADEVADPRPVAELIRQWSTDHPEFQFLPRKFKIAVSGSPADRAIARAHDIGLVLTRDAAGRRGFAVHVGGGLGRTPILAEPLFAFLPEADLLPCLEAILSVYNLAGRRDNKYKARIKITVSDLGIDAFRQLVLDEIEQRKAENPAHLAATPANIEHQFDPPRLSARDMAPFHAALAADAGFRRWAAANLSDHARADHAIVTVTLKAPGATPGDVTAGQMRLLADLADRLGHGELRFTQDQNIVLPHVARADLPALWRALEPAGLATPNAGRVTDIVACPGMDYCTLATARSIPVATGIADRFRALGLEDAIGALRIKISGCINACGHHHLGHIGILGLERAGVETYQITLGGETGAGAAIGERAGPGFSADGIVDAIERLVRAYLAARTGPDEDFAAAYRRLGPAPFRAALYPEGERDAA